MLSFPILAVPTVYAPKAKCLKDLKKFLVVCLIFSILLSCKKSEVSSEDLPDVYIKENDGNFQLIRNGKPFYMKGGAAHPSFLLELKEAGGNTARIYDTINLQQTLNKAEALSLAAVVDIPMPKFNSDPQFYENPELFKNLKQRVERVVKQHKDHPALLYWNLGNELYYPYFYTNTDFFEKFNELIDVIHGIDPNHPVSTVTIGANKLRVLSIHRKSPDLDFISFNSFGVLSQFEEKLKPISPIWSGPHVITEWGVNGPWEALNTLWKAPIEEPSTKKAEQIVERHQKYITPLKEINSLGSFIFYWGKKNEITPTWYSLFMEDGKKTQAVFELSNIWNNTQKKYPGPKINYLLLNDKGAAQSVMLTPGSKAEIEVVLPEGELQKNLEYNWEVRRESWFESHISNVVPNINFDKKDTLAIFNVPKEEGPYRVFLTISDGTEYVATANFPFYVLNSNDGEQN